MEGAMLRPLRTVLLGFGLVSAQSALAADLPASTPAPAQYVKTTWSGFYAGANAGYGWSHMEAVGAGSADADGFVGGGQIGVNWQSGAFVLGVEGDFQGSAIRTTNSLSPVVSLTSKIPYFATARARLGMAVGDLLIFATGGAAYVAGDFTIAAGAISSNTSATQVTWTAGGGAEWMFAPQWSLKAEYLYIDTGNMAVTLPTFLPGGFTTSGRLNLQTARVGVNFHF